MGGSIAKLGGRFVPVMFVLLFGCTRTAETPPPAPPPTPPAAELPPPPLPEPPPRPKRQSYSVPENTRNPVLVEKGVHEWLDRHPDYEEYKKVAILRRMRQESSFNPCAIGGPHHYLLQWRDARLRNLYKFAHVKPGVCPSWLAQLEFMHQEIRSTERYAKFLRSTPKNAYEVFTVAYLGGKIVP